ncbi:MAG: hypothetical protein KAJ03_05460 [Gammaproteobacteria bacterium]|nr:hypothetical protein [Gammaproteobacteria bacterium]
MNTYFYSGFEVTQSGTAKKSFCGTWEYMESEGDELVYLTRDIIASMDSNLDKDNVVLTTLNKL